MPDGTLQQILDALHEQDVKLDDLAKQANQSNIHLAQINGEIGRLGDRVDYHNGELEQHRTAIVNHEARIAVANAVEELRTKQQEKIQWWTWDRLWQLTMLAGVLGSIAVALSK